jgi:hypothetical protein
VSISGTAIEAERDLEGNVVRYRVANGTWRYALSTERDIKKSSNWRELIA